MHIFYHFLYIYEYVYIWFSIQHLPFSWSMFIYKYKYVYKYIHTQTPCWQILSKKFKLLLGTSTGCGNFSNLQYNDLHKFWGKPLISQTCCPRHEDIMISGTFPISPEINNGWFLGKNQVLKHLIPKWRCWQSRRDPNRRCGSSESPASESMRIRRSESSAGAVGSVKGGWPRATICGLWTQTVVFWWWLEGFGVSHWGWLWFEAFFWRILKPQSGTLPSSWFFSTVDSSLY